MADDTRDGSGNDPGPSSCSPPVETSHDAADIVANEKRNILSLSLHFVCLRLGWIFKTETVIMPAFLDTIAGAGWLRGCLPVLNRIGSSLPPLLYAPRLRNAGRKKWTLMGATLLMALPFFVLAVTWFSIDQSRRPGWLPVLFLTCYTICFVGTGLNRLAFATVQGKLIRDNRRGRLMLISGLLGSLVAVTCSVILFPRWLGLPDHGFGWIFLVTAGGFIAAGLSAGFIAEPADVVGTERPRPRQVFHAAWRLFWDNPAFRRIAVVGMLFISVQLAFPHYQKLGRIHLDDADEGLHLMYWVVAQNIGFGVFSIVFGRIADSRGNRLAIRIQIFLLAAVPLVAILLASPLVRDGGRLFWIPFSFLGLTPLTCRTINNYVLELAPPSEHPRYISTLSLAMAVPFVVAPFVGLLVDLIGFPPVFVGVSVIVALGGLMTIGMSEPRRDEHLEETPPIGCPGTLQ